MRSYLANPLWRHPSGFRCARQTSVRAARTPLLVSRTCRRVEPVTRHAQHFSIERNGTTSRATLDVLASGANQRRPGRTPADHADDRFGAAGPLTGLAQCHGGSRRPAAARAPPLATFQSSRSDAVGAAARYRIRPEGVARPAAAGTTASPLRRSSRALPSDSSSSRNAVTRSVPTAHHRDARRAGEVRRISSRRRWGRPCRLPRRGRLLPRKGGGL